MIYEYAQPSCDTHVSTTLKLCMVPYALLCSMLDAPHLDVGDDTIPAWTTANRMVFFASSDQAAGTVTAQVTLLAATRSLPHCSHSFPNAHSFKKRR